MSNVCSKPECCGPTTSEYETLKAENELLKSQINRIVNDVEAGSSEEVRINKILHPECFEDSDDEKEDEIDNMLGEIKELRDKKEELDNCFQELCDDIIKSGATWGACSHPSDLVASWVYETIDEIDDLKEDKEILETYREEIGKIEKYTDSKIEDIVDVLPYIEKLKAQVGKLIAENDLLKAKNGELRGSEDEIEELKRKAEELEMEVSMCVQDKEEDIAKLEKYVRAWNIIGSNHWDWFSDSLDKTTALRFIDLGVAEKDDFCWDIWSDDE